MNPSLLPRLLIAAGMLRALARLLTLTAAMADRETADACVHEGVEECESAMDRLSGVLADSGPMAARTEACEQADRIYMDTPEADTLLRWAEGWEMMAERLGKEG